MSLSGRRVMGCGLEVTPWTSRRFRARRELQAGAALHVHGQCKRRARRRTHRVLLHVKRRPRCHDAQARRAEDTSADFTFYEFLRRPRVSVTSQFRPSAVRSSTSPLPVAASPRLNIGMASNLVGTGLGVFLVWLRTRLTN